MLIDQLGHLKLADFGTCMRMDKVEHLKLYLIQQSHANLQINMYMWLFWTKTYKNIFCSEKHEFKANRLCLKRISNFQHYDNYNFFNLYWKSFISIILKTGSIHLYCCFFWGGAMSVQLLFISWDQFGI